MSIRDRAKKLKVLNNTRKDDLRKKIACVGGASASKLSLELDRIEREIFQLRNATRPPSTRI